MKILHIITDINTGGAITLLKKITSKNIDHNIKHVIISLKEANEFAKIPNIDKIYSLNIKFKIFFFLKFFYLIRIIRIENPNVVQTWMYHADFIGGLAAKILRIKKIYWSVLSYSVSSRHVKFSTRIIIYINSLFSHFIPDKIIFCASSAQNVHRKIGYCSSKFIFIPIGFHIKNQSTNKNKVFSIGCIARWDQQKDHKNLFEALSMLDKKNINYKCHLVGPAMISDNKELQALIRTTNVDRVKLNLRGFVKDIDTIYNELDLCILSSCTEAFPIVIGESMSIGTPVIATDTGDIKEIINNFGWVVPISNPKELSNSILDAIRKSSEIKTWSSFRSAARKHIINNYSINDMLNKYNKLWFSKS